MTIMESDARQPSDTDGKPVEASDNPPVQAENPAKEDVQEDDFSSERLMEDINVPSKGITVTAAEKVAFIDAVVNNTRFTKDYSLFGGKVRFTLRSLTSEETNALSAWAIKQGSNDSASLLAGKYRKFLMAAQVAMMNGVDMPPLEEPLFETLDHDGKTVIPPGWIGRCKYWDGLGVGLFEAIMKCISDFDNRYSLLCQKAEDANFWAPDTP